MSKDEYTSIKDYVLPPLEVLCCQTIMEKLLVGASGEECLEFLRTVPDCSSKLLREMIIKKCSNENSLSSEVLKEFLHHGITTLELSNFQFTENLQLANSINGCQNIILKNITTTSLLSFSVFGSSRMEYKNVISLDLSYCFCIFDEDVELFCTNFPSLLVLSLAGCQELTPTFLMHVSRCRQLRELDVSYNFISLCDVNWLSSLTTLSKLVASGVNGEDSSSKITFFSNQLKVLELSELSGITSPVVVLDLVRNQLCSLTVLKLSALPIPGDELIAAFKSSSTTAIRSVNCPLTYLDLSWCDRVLPDCFSELLLMLPELQSLILRCSDANTRTVLTACENCPHLTELNLSRCADIDDEACFALSRHGGIRSLDLSWSRVTDAGVTALYDCQKLQVLSLQGCKHLTDLLIHTLLSNIDAVPVLKFIDFSWVNMFSKEMAVELSKQRNTLVVVDYYCEVYSCGSVIAEFL